MPCLTARKPDAPPAPPPPCERCGRAPRSGRIRYCKVCKKAVLRSLESAGYLQPLPRPHRFRPPDAREDVGETTGHVTRRRTAPGFRPRRRPSPDARVIP